MENFEGRLNFDYHVNANKKYPMTCSNECLYNISVFKVDSNFSSWEMSFSVVPQGSIIGPLLFNIYICDMFFEIPENIDFAGYADDNTLYTHSSKIEHVLTNLQGALEKLFYCFFFLQIPW